MQEKIGNIILDETFYPGVDLYCDGQIEDELLTIVKENEESRFREIIEERHNWPILYHLSPMRENIVNWIPMRKDAKVLEVGSGCGAITGALAHKAGSVTCIDLSKKRSMINAYRHKDCDNVLIHVGNFKDIEVVLDCDYDFIFLTGVFEYGQGYMGSNTPYEDFMNILTKHLKPQGHLVIAIENKLGMKYFAGCTEDHTGGFFDGIMDYPNGGGVRTFSKEGLERILKACGQNEYTFYYPYPDYKFATTIFSDDIGPKVGELHDNIRNFDRGRVILFDETAAFDSVVKDGLFPIFSNSLMVITGPKLDTVYSKFSNDRAPQYCIRTDICKEGNDFCVKKTADNDKAQNHIEHINEMYHKLCDRYAGSDLSFNICHRQSDGLKFDFVPGVTLEEKMDECVSRKDKENFLTLFRRFVTIASYNKEIPVTDYDFIFQNIMVDGNQWTAIDYEWTFEKAIEPEILISRALYCYLLGNTNRSIIKEWLQEEFAAFFAEEDKIASMEHKFQQYVQDYKVKALCEIRDDIGCEAPSLSYLLEKAQARTPQVQIYEDCGNGYSEENSYQVSDIRQRGENTEFEIKLKRDLTNIRIDPSPGACMVTLLSVKEGDKELLPELLSGKHTKFRSHNGSAIAKNVFLFTKPDPHFEWKIKGMTEEKESIWKVIMKVTVL